jgi:hypothetical protein
MSQTFLAERARKAGKANQVEQRRRREAQYALMVATLGLTGAMSEAYRRGYSAGYNHRRNIELREIAQAMQAKRKAEQAA